MINFTTDSIRARILEQIEISAESLLVLLPNNSDAEPKILWARSSLDPKELPAAVITPEPETADGSYGADVMTMAVTISLVCLIGSHNPVDLAEYLLAEMRRQIPHDRTLGGLAQEMKYVQGGVNDYPERDEQGLSVFTTFEIEYWTEINNPEKGV